MRISRLLLAPAVIAAALVGAGATNATSRDYGELTCGNFLASGRANMAVIIWWQRGYHAGKSVNLVFDDADPYAGRLGAYCGSHRDANLIDTSERILSELDRGI